jgi:hypothetical protein
LFFSLLIPSIQLGAGDVGSRMASSLPPGRKRRLSTSGWKSGGAIWDMRGVRPEVPSGNDGREGTRHLKPGGDVPRRGTGVGRMEEFRGYALWEPGIHATMAPYSRICPF